jgi:hypothetical protein
MAINIPAAWANSTPKAFLDILTLDGGQAKLPASARLMAGCVAAYAVAQAALHALDRALAPSAIFGFGCAALLGGATAGVLHLYKSREKVLQAISALAGVGAVIALASIALHFVFAVALPPPLPTGRLVSFLLFPMVVWNVFAFAFIYRHAGIRTIPAFSFATAYVITVNFIMSTLLH